MGLRILIDWNLGFSFDGIKDADLWNIYILELRNLI